MSILQETTNYNNQDDMTRSRSHYRGEIRCANSGEVFHQSTDIYSNGFYAYKLQLWFCSTFDYNEYCFNNSICAYSNPAYRNQMAKYFNRDFNKYKTQQEKYNSTKKANEETN